MTTVHQAQSPLTAPGTRPPRRSGTGWFVTGAILLLTALTLLIAGAVVQAIDDSWRHDGYLTSREVALTTSSHAITTERIDLADIAPLWPDVDGLLGKVRLRAESTDGKPVFIGIAPAGRAEAYLNGVGHATLTELADPATTYAEHPGGAPGEAPAGQDFWVARAAGSGTQVVEWPPTEGDWTLVVMNADGSAGVDADIDVGITAPVQEWGGRVLLIVSAFLGLLGALFVFVGFRRRR